MNSIISHQHSLHIHFIAFTRWEILTIFSSLFIVDNCDIWAVFLSVSVSELLMGEIDSTTLLSLPPTEKSRVSVCVVCVCVVCVCVCVCVCVGGCCWKRVWGCFLRCLASILFPCTSITDSTESLTTWVFEKHLLRMTLMTN